jgi:hypothetical protein
MAQSKPILNKIARNLSILGISYSQGASSITLSSGEVISYVDSDIAAPMGGVNPSVSPFLGIGECQPGQIKMKGAAGDNSLAAIFISESLLKAWSILGNFANDKIVEAGDTTAELARVPGHPDMQNMGQ